MKNKSITFFFLSVAVLLMGRNIVLAANDKVTICHATSSATTPYTRIVVSENAIGGHFENPGTPKSGHEDDLFFYGEVDCPGGETETTPTPTDSQNVPTPTESTQEPTPTTRPGDVNEGNIDLPCIFGCPTSTPTATNTPTPTTVQPTPTEKPTDNPSGGTGGSSSSSTNTSPSTQGSVLGATTLAPTGTFAQTAANLSFMLGMGFMAIAVTRYYRQLV